MTEIQWKCFFLKSAGAVVDFALDNLVVVNGEGKCLKGKYLDTACEWLPNHQNYEANVNWLFITFVTKVTSEMGK